MPRTIKILAIDDEEIILKSLKKALKNDAVFNYEVTTCSTALDGLKIIRSDNFDLVFVDFILPGINGIEVLRRIKNISSAVHVIIMSGFSSAGIQNYAINNDTEINETLKNSEGFLLKPFTTEELKTIITGILGNGKK